MFSPLLVDPELRIEGLAVTPAGTTHCGVAQFAPKFNPASSVPPTVTVSAFDPEAAAVQVIADAQSAKVTPPAFHVTVWFIIGVDTVIVP